MIDFLLNSINNNDCNVAIKGYSSICLTYKHVRKKCDLFSEFIAYNLKNRYECIGLLMSHNLYIPSIVISLLKNEHTFAFLDPYTSTEKNMEMIEKLGITWVINCSNELCEVTLLNKFSFYDKIVFTNATFELWKSNNKVEQIFDFKNICYVVCTSGSTGEPKIVRVSFDSIWSNIKGLKDIFKLTVGDVIYFGTPLTFDPSMIELFLSLTSGATLLIVPKQIQMNPPKLLCSIFPKDDINHGITFLQMPPSVFLRWTQEEIKFILQKTRLKVLALGGEKFPTSILNFKKLDDLRIFNLYGITEISCWASVCEVQDNLDVHLGHELPDTVLEVRDGNLAKIVEGEGDLFIGSNTRWCLINEEKHLKGLIFRSTGDFVNIKSNKIQYLGRKTRTAKRNGIKINLNQIESRIQEITDVENKCFAKEICEKTNIFVIFRIQDLDYSIKNKIIDKLRVKLLHHLPHEWFPNCIEIVQNFPLTSHGKINENILYNLYFQEVGVEMRDPLLVFNDLIKKIFGLTDDQLNLYADSTFLELGGNSVLIIHLLEEFKRYLNQDYPKELATVLIENTLKDCRNFVTKFTFPKSIKREHPDEESGTKRVKQQNAIELKVAWKYDFKACVDSSPVVLRTNSEDLVAVGSFSTILAVLNARTGVEVSKVLLSEPVENACNFSKEQSCVFVPCYDGKLYYIDVKTGNILREYTTNGQIKNTPVFCLDNSAVIFGSYDKYVHCIKKDTFEIVWKCDLKESVTSDIVCHKSKIFLATIQSSFVCLNETNGNVLWKMKADSPIFGSPVLLNSDCICWPTVLGKIQCVTCATGKEIWSFKTEGNIYSSLIQHENHLIFGSYDHGLYCISIKDRSLKFKTKLDSPIRGTSSIIKCGKDLIVTATTSGNIYVIDFDSGEIFANFVLGGETFSSPCVCDNLIYIGCRDNNLYCLELII